MSSELKVLWLRPSTGENVSVRRQRIAEKLEKRDIEVELCDASSSDLPKAILTAISGDHDIIIGNVRIGLYIGFPLAKLLRKPFIGDVSDPISDIDPLPEVLFRAFRWYEWRVLSNADASVFVQDSVHREAAERGIDGVRLPNAVNYEMFAEPDPDVVNDAHSILQEHGVDLDHPVAIYIGRFPGTYHIREILEAAQQTPDWEFVFVGSGELEEQVSQVAEMESNVAYPGVFEYRLMPGFLNHATAGFCLTDSEQPLKLKEYGAARLITLAAPGALTELYDPDEVVFVETDPKEISEKLETIKRKPGEFEGYGDRMQRIAKSHSWDQIAKGYCDLFESVLER